MRERTNDKKNKKELVLQIHSSLFGGESYIFFPSFAFFAPKKWENPLLPAYSVLRGFLLRRRVETRRTRTENRNEEFCWFLLFPISPPLTAHFSKNSPIAFSSCCSSSFLGFFAVSAPFSPILFVVVPPYWSVVPFILPLLFFPSF